MPDPHSDHEEALEQIRRGDAQAFERLFHAEYAALCAFARRRVDSPSVAEDLVQSAFLRLWASRAGLQNVESPRAYLYRAVRNAALDHRKHEEVEARWEHAAALEQDEEQPLAAEGELEREEQARSLHAAIDGLTPRGREVVTLRWLRGMSAREIALALDISVKGVEIHITRALRALRAHLRGAGPPE